MLRERLAGKRLLITGVTGFVGEALLERLLSDLPDTRLLVLIRPRSGQSGRDRLGPAARQAGLRRSCARAPPSRSCWPASTSSRAISLPSRSCPPTSTWSCTAPARCRSTRRSTRASPPTSAACARCCAPYGQPERTVSRARRHPLRARLHRLRRRAAVGARRRGAVPHSGDWKAEEAAALRIRQSAEDASRAPAALDRVQRAGGR